MTELSRYRNLLADIYGGRRWVLALDVLAGAAPLVSALGALGAESCFCVATARGAGDPPDPVLCPNPVVLGVKAHDVMSSIRASLDALANLPSAVVAQIDDFDPERSARVVGTIFDDGRAVAGRQKWGARPAAWQALEDKTLIDAVWDEIGIARAPSLIVASSLDELTGAGRALDAGLGCVWTGDNREGFHGAATYLRWVRDEAQASEASAFFAKHCARVRVMPFLEGIPCSIHGIAFRESTIAVRPCEMLVFRRRGSAELHYGRAATFWDPPPGDREHMRAIAYLVGDYLRERVAYRGMFTVDGVLTADGFRPTELNPRFGAGLACAQRGMPGVPLFLLHLAIAEGVDADFRPRELEQLLVEAADSHRAGGGLAVTERRIDKTERFGLVLGHDGTFRIAGADDTPDATAILGPAVVGSFLSIDLVPERTPVGSSVAARVAAALACVDARFGLGIGPLDPPRSAREVSLVSSKAGSTGC